MNLHSRSHFERGDWEEGLVVLDLARPRNAVLDDLESLIISAMVGPNSNPVVKVVVDGDFREGKFRFFFSIVTSIDRFRDCAAADDLLAYVTRAVDVQRQLHLRLAGWTWDLRDSSNEGVYARDEVGRHRILAFHGKE